jgi:DnaJ homologue, subfamily C, member 28, conserved domain
MAEESGHMTDRKPAGMSFTSWIDRQIADAEERGAFDNLPGSGKPLPKRDEGDAAQAWLRDYLRREGVPAEELLPVSLRLRKKRERLADSVHLLRSEEEVRDAVAELNQQIRDWRRIPLDSPIFVRLVDEEEIVRRWREAQPG